jgi:ribose-phosphate pyrophosphokinase
MNIIGDVDGPLLHPGRRHRRLGRHALQRGGGAEEGGAQDVVAYCTHGVLSGGAVPRVDTSSLSELVITDSIATYEAAAASEKIRILTIAPLLAEAIKRIADETSVSSLFD